MDNSVRPYTALELSALEFEGKTDELSPCRLIEAWVKARAAINEQNPSCPVGNANYSNGWFRRRVYGSFYDKSRRSAFEQEVVSLHVRIRRSPERERDKSLHDELQPRSFSIMAAGPALLEALIDIERTASGPVNGKNITHQTRLEECLLVARAAIARATN